MSHTTTNHRLIAPARRPRSLALPEEPVVTELVAPVDATNDSSPISLAKPVSNSLPSSPNSPLAQTSSLSRPPANIFAPILQPVLPAPAPFSLQPRQSSLQTLLEKLSNSPQALVATVKNFQIPRYAYVLATLVLLVTAYTAINTHLTNQQYRVYASPPAAISEPSATSAEEVPIEEPNPTAISEEKPKEEQVVEYYASTSGAPRYLRIPKLGITNARVLEVGRTVDNNIGAPTNLWDTAWFNESAVPEENGAVIIDGHFGGPGQNSIFRKLHTLVHGDRIELELNDGQVFTYEVRHVITQKVEEIDMKTFLQPFAANDQGLNLFTCAGNWNGTTQTYDARTLVYTVKI